MTSSPRTLGRPSTLSKVLRCYSGLESVSDSISSLMNEFRNRVGLTLPPYDPVQAIVALGARVSFSASLPFSGLISETDGCTYVMVDSREHQHRQRFTLAHELTHLLLMNLAISMGLRRTVAAHGAEVEWICNIGAAEFLMPMNDVRSLSWMDPAPQVVVEGQRVFEVSVEASARRLLEVWGRDFQFAVLRRRPRIKHEGPYQILWHTYGASRWPHPKVTMSNWVSDAADRMGRMHGRWSIHICSSSTVRVRVSLLQRGDLLMLLFDPREDRCDRDEGSHELKSQASTRGRDEYRQMQLPGMNFEGE